MLHLPKITEVVHAMRQSHHVVWAIPEGATLEQLRDELLALMNQENSNHLLIVGGVPEVPITNRRVIVRWAA